MGARRDVLVDAHAVTNTLPYYFHACFGAHRNHFKVVKTV